MTSPGGPIDDAPFGYLTTAADGLVLSANQTLSRWLGCEGADLVSRRRFPDLLTQGSRVYWLTHHVPRLERRGRVDTVALDLLRPGGHDPLPVLVTGVVARPLPGEPLTVTIMVVDASQRRAYERELVAARLAAEGAEWRMRALHRVSAACMGSTPPGGLLDEVAVAVTEGVEGTGAAVWVTGPDGPDLRLAARHGDPTRRGVGDAEPVPAALAAWRSGSAVLDLPHPGSPGVLALPIRAGDTCLGAVEIALPAAWRGDEADVADLALMGGIIGQAIARARLHDQLRHLALHDPLTGLASRRLLADRYLQLSARARRSQQPIGLMFLDLDGFKGINDRYGHAAGDQVLAAVAQRLVACLRATDTVARLGGDEFVVLCEDTDLEGAQAVARRIRTALAEPLTLTAGEVGGLAASIGVRVHRPRANAVDDLETLLEAADADMYRVKRRHRAAAAGRTEVTEQVAVGLADSAHGRTG